MPPSFSKAGSATAEVKPECRGGSRTLVGGQIQWIEKAQWEDPWIGQIFSQRIQVLRLYSTATLLVSKNPKMCNTPILNLKFALPPT